MVSSRAWQDRKMVIWDHILKIMTIFEAFRWMFSSSIRGAELGAGGLYPPSFGDLFSKFWLFFENPFFAIYCSPLIKNLLPPKLSSIDLLLLKSAKMCSTNNYLVAGAAINPNNNILATQIGCSVGIGNMCFTKKVLSSITCHNRMNWKMATKRIHEQPGSNQRAWFHDSGVNCNKALFSLPVFELIFLKDSQWCSRISNHRHTVIPVKKFN